MFALIDSLSLNIQVLLATLLSLGLSLGLGPYFIRTLQRLQMKQVVRQEGPKSHYSKQGTPTLGGILLIFSWLCPALIMAPLTINTVLMLITILGFGVIGFLDDYLKVFLKHNRGLPARWKYLCQSVLGLLLGIACLHLQHISLLSLSGLGLLFFYYLIIVGSSNAVNLTDGLDGLVTGPVILVALGLAACILLSSTPPSGSPEILIILGCLVGAGLGFLWFNAHPAQVFMGDVGALSLGALLGLISILIQHEWIFALMGGVFVVETLSVILQVASFRLRGGKRIFKMSPIHHHFELSGSPETRVVMRFWVASAGLVLLGVLVLVLAWW